MPIMSMRGAATMGSGAAIAAVLLLAGLPSPVAAQGAGLAGAWSGSGRITLSTGDSERARCRVNFRRQTPKSFGMTATCATPSARVSQVAQVQQVSPTSYEGRFYNREYDVTGTVRIAVNGRRLTAYLRGGGASASLSLTR